VKRESAKGGPATSTCTKSGSGHSRNFDTARTKIETTDKGLLHRENFTVRARAVERAARRPCETRARSAWATGASEQAARRCRPRPSAWPRERPSAPPGHVKGLLQLAPPNAHPRLPRCRGKEKKGWFLPERRPDGAPRPPLPAPPRAPAAPVRSLPRCQDRGSRGPRRMTVAFAWCQLVRMHCYPARVPSVTPLQQPPAPTAGP